ncbi:hypothetical protein A7G45_27170 [Mycolicibacterium llatzerense]|nr:hypothetical protein [Mycolicibacterium llatzerense]MCT7371487.1 hypothetical protein [Mycolicibacterium llatzerense]
MVASLLLLDCGLGLWAEVVAESSDVDAGVAPGCAAVAGVGGCLGAGLLGPAASVACEVSDAVDEGSA